LAGKKVRTTSNKKINSGAGIIDLGKNVQGNIP
jgi:hypothetical protein